MHMPLCLYYLVVILYCPGIQSTKYLGGERQNSAATLHLKSPVFKQVNCFCGGLFYCLFRWTVVQDVKIRSLLLWIILKNMRQVKATTGTEFLTHNWLSKGNCLILSETVGCLQSLWAKRVEGNVYIPIIFSSTKFSY